jgi:hypothetical protein
MTSGLVQGCHAALPDTAGRANIVGMMASDLYGTAGRFLQWGAMLHLCLP